MFGACAAGFGAYAEHTLLDAVGAALKPANVSWADAATIPVSAGTAYDGVEQLGLDAEDTLLVVGAGGGVGIAVLQLARERGARVVGAASPAKRELVESFGADWISPQHDAAPGVSAVFDMVGGDVLRARTPSGVRPVSVADPTLATELGGSGVTRRRTTAVFAAIADLVGEGRLDVGVRQRFPLVRAGRRAGAGRVGPRDGQDGHRGRLRRWSAPAATASGQRGQEGAGPQPDQHQQHLGPPRVSCMASTPPPITNHPAQVASAHRCRTPTTTPSACSRSVPLTPPNPITSPATRAERQ